jgi:hypothetical protein
MMTETLLQPGEPPPLKPEDQTDPPTAVVQMNPSGWKIPRRAAD